MVQQFNLVGLLREFEEGVLTPERLPLDYYSDSVIFQEVYFSK